MKIQFRVEEILTVEDLIQLHRQEDVGWDRCGGNSRAMLVFPRNGKLIEHRVYNYTTADAVVSGGKVTLGDRQYPTARFFKGPTWITCCGGFTYTQLEGEVWEYEGAINGFLSQNLIPPTFKESRRQVLSCEGRYGKFEGPDSLTNYRRLRENWRGIWDGLLSGTIIENNLGDSLPEVGPYQMFCTEHTVGEVADLVWDRLYRRRNYDGLNEVPNHPIIESMGLDDDKFDATPILERAIAAIQESIENLAFRRRR